MEGGREKGAEKIFRSVIRKFPQHIDALHHLAMILDSGGREEEAMELWEKAVSIGKDRFPEEFVRGKSLLEWGWMENRPFLRACHGLGLAYQKRGYILDAAAIFDEMLELNPNDNQGIRALAIECYFAQGDPQGVLKVCERFPDDGMGETMFGRSLAYFQLGNSEMAREAMMEAIEYHPNIAKELIKTRPRKPEAMMEGYIVAGGDDEAYEYWTSCGRYWKATEGALDFLKKCLRK